MEVKEEDIVKNFLSASSHDNLLFFTNRGRVFQIIRSEDCQTLSWYVINYIIYYVNSAVACLCGVLM